jgi:hypothetical protein
LCQIIRTEYGGDYRFIAQIKRKARQAPQVCSAAITVQLTTDFSPVSPIAEALLLDGKFLAYAGPFRIHVMVIATRESYPVRPANGLRAFYITWLLDSTKLLVSGLSERPHQVRTWTPGG